MFISSHDLTGFQLRVCLFCLILSALHLFSDTCIEMNCCCARAQAFQIRTDPERSVHENPRTPVEFEQQLPTDRLNCWEKVCRQQRCSSSKSSSNFNVLALFFKFTKVMLMFHSAYVYSCLNNTDN